MKLVVKFFVLIFLFSGISFSDELRTLTNKGISAFKKGDFTAALEHFGAAVEKYPMSNEARFNKGLALGATENAKEAEIMLSSVRFEKDSQNAEVLFSRARISEAVGDAAILNQQQPNISEAKKAYQFARSLYAQSLDLIKDKKARQRTVNNIEILSQKIKNLPEQDPNENEQNEQNKDENRQNEENNENEEQENEKNQDENQQNEENEQQNEQQQNEQDEQIEDAIRLLEHYADDAKELNKPPVQKAVPSADGRDW